MGKLKVGTKVIVGGRYTNHRAGVTTGKAYWSETSLPPGWIYLISFSNSDEYWHEDFLLPIPDNVTRDQIEALKSICDLHIKGEV